MMPRRENDKEREIREARARAKKWAKDDRDQERRAREERYVVMHRLASVATLGLHHCSFPLLPAPGCFCDTLPACAARIAPNPPR